MFSPRTMASEDIDSTGSVTEGCYLFGNPRTFWAFEASVLFPENFWSNLTFYESENFSDFSQLHHIFESEKFGVSFFYEK